MQLQGQTRAKKNWTSKEHIYGCSVSYIHIKEMSDAEPKVGRNKKDDKARRNKELTGGLSSRHARIAEAQATNKPPSAKEKKKK